MPPKIVKQTAAQKRDLKKKEAFDLAKEALTADTVAVREDENVVELEQAPAEVPPALAEINAAEIKRCVKRMKALEHKLDIAYEHSQYAVPTEIMDGLGITNSASSIKNPEFSPLGGPIWSLPQQCQNIHQRSHRGARLLQRDLDDLLWRKNGSDLQAAPPRLAQRIPPPHETRKGQQNDQARRTDFS